MKNQMKMGAALHLTIDLQPGGQMGSGLPLTLVARLWHF